MICWPEATKRCHGPNVLEYVGVFCSKILLFRFILPQSIRWPFLPRLVQPAQVARIDKVRLVQRVISNFVRLGVQAGDVSFASRWRIQGKVAALPQTASEGRIEKPVGAQYSYMIALYDE